MLTPDEALARILALGDLMPREAVPLLDAKGRWLADTLIARRTQPACDLSAMDGYAVSGEGPWHLVGMSSAGKAWPGTLEPSQAVRIFTGAATPAGTQAVVMQEDVEVCRQTITRTDRKSLINFQNMRTKGSDFVAGDVVANAGAAITPGLIGLAAAAGHTTLAVCERPRVALIATGDELVPVGKATLSDQIPASNSIMLHALLSAMPCTVTDLGIVPDRLDALTAILDNAKDFDIIVTTGGASVGDHDHVRAALQTIGATIDFWKIAMRPGKPLIAGTLDKSVFLGLPGNPVSSFVTATLFLKPLIAKMAGDSTPGFVTTQATLAAPCPAVGVRTDFIRGTRQGDSVTPLPGDSGMLLPLSQADVLIVRDAHAPPARKGDRVFVIVIA